MSRSTQNRASIALLIATIGWGGGFTWAKIGGRTINETLGVGIGGPIGPIALLAARFIAAGILWLLIFPKSRRGWSWASLYRAGVIGLLLAVGLGAQHLGLDITPVAISAFLTSLTIVFVPLLSTIALRKSPNLITWLAVVVAVIGVCVMTGVGGISSLGVGEWLGLGCAIDFSLYILVVNAMVARDDPFRMSGGQFIAAGIFLLAAVPFLPPTYASPSGLHRLVQCFAMPSVWLNGTCLIAFSTLLAYGLLTHFQPRIDATRAALIYLIEPIFASLYAWRFAGEPMKRHEIIGAAIILFVNLMVEVIHAMTQRPKTADFAPHEPV